MPDWLKYTLGVLAVLFVLGLIFGEDTETTKYQTIAEAKKQGVEPPPVIAKRPDDQTKFVNIIITAQREAKKVSNDMQLGGVKAKRNTDICSVLQSYHVVNWTGYVERIDSNSDGKGVLSVEIVPSVYIKTWNNSFSDISTNTLISQNSDLFKVASSLETGDPIIFSGNFFRDGGDCIDEQSLTLEGKTTQPEFTFRFSKIMPIK